MCRNYAPQSDVIDPNQPKNASYWKRQAKRLQEELLTANCRITELEKENSALREACKVLTAE